MSAERQKAAAAAPDAAPERPVAVFMPPLAVTLAAAEQQKGSPLTEAEVLGIRDRAIVMMNPPAVARTLEESRGFRDVDPESAWSDWHRLRAQLGHGFLPKMVLCVIGPAGFGEACQKELAAEKDNYGELEVRPADPRMPTAFKCSECRADPSMSEEDYQAIAKHGTVVYLVSANYAPADALDTARTMLGLGARLLKAGGLAMKCESSGIAHSRDHWLELDADSRSADLHRATHALIRAFVQLPISAEDSFYSCGAHLLGVPDLIAPGALLGPEAAVDTFRVFLLYLLAECQNRVFRNGDTLRLEAAGPRYKLTWEPCTYYDEDDFFFNSFGRWRFHAAPPPAAKK